MEQLKGSTNKNILACKFGLSETSKVKCALDVALKSGVRSGNLINIDTSCKLVNTAEEKQGTCKSKREMPSKKGKGKRIEKIANAL